MEEGRSVNDSILERLVWVQYEDLWWPAILYHSYLELQQDVYSQLNSYVIKAQFALSIMRQLQEKRQVRVARLLGRPTLEIVEVLSPADYKEFYFHVADLLPQVCDMGNYRSRLDLFVDVHRALDEVERLFMTATNSGMGLPMGEYKSWFDRAQGKMNNMPIKLRDSRNEDEDVESVNSLLNFRQSMGQFPRVVRETTTDQTVNDVLALAKELMHTTKTGNFLSSSYSPNPGTPTTVSPQPTESTEPRNRFTVLKSDDDSHTSSLSSHQSMPPAIIMHPPSSQPAPSSQSASLISHEELTSVRGKSGLKLPSLVHKARAQQVTGSCSESGSRGTQQSTNRRSTPSPILRNRSEESHPPTRNVFSLCSSSEASTRVISNRARSSTPDDRAETQSTQEKGDGGSTTSRSSRGIKFPMTYTTMQKVVEDDEGDEIDVLVPSPAASVQQHQQQRPPTPPRTPTMDMDRLSLSPSQLHRPFRRPSPRRPRKPSSSSASTSSHRSRQSPVPPRQDQASWIQEPKWYLDCRAPPPSSSRSYTSARSSPLPQGNGRSETGFYKSYC